MSNDKIFRKGNKMTDFTKKNLGLHPYSWNWAAFHEDEKQYSLRGKTVYATLDPIARIGKKRKCVYITQNGQGTFNRLVKANANAEPFAVTYPSQTRLLGLKLAEMAERWHNLMHAKIFVEEMFEEGETE